MLYCAISSGGVKAKLQHDSLRILKYHMVNIENLNVVKPIKKFCITVLLLTSFCAT